MKRRKFVQLTGIGATSLSLGTLGRSIDIAPSIYSFPQMVGEVSQTSAILQTRLSQHNSLPDGPRDIPEALVSQDIPGAAGVARFEIAENASFSGAQLTPWRPAEASEDFIVKHHIHELKPGTRHYVRVHFGPSEEQTRTGVVSQFKTLPPADSEESISFVVSSCMCLGHFLLGRGDNEWEKPVQGRDRELGYPALETIERLDPAFWVQTGDNVYYDHPSEEPAKTREALRAKWHRQMALPRVSSLLQNVPVFWMKDDHDYRYNDGDDQNREERPSPELGITTFREQVPVVDGNQHDAVTYRTRRVNNLLQIWMPEGRDYRDPNAMPDGPQKSIWGKEQFEWLKHTLLSSDSIFKLLIVPSPLIGPDDGYKHDNHTNYGGFQHERDEFFRWLKEHNFQEKNFYIVTGDRHWQYHSIHPSGFEEYGTGTITTPHARMGREPGDPASTDPLGLITQPYIQKEPTGGFLSVEVKPSRGDSPARLILTTMDEGGNVLYRDTKEAV